jgi:hypothetical protein
MDQLVRLDCKVLLAQQVQLDQLVLALLGQLVRLD